MPVQLASPTFRPYSRALEVSHHGYKSRAKYVIGVGAGEIEKEEQAVAFLSWQLGN